MAVAAVTALLLVGGSGGLDVLQTNTPTTNSPTGAGQPAHGHPTNASHLPGATRGGAPSKHHAPSAHPASAGAPAPATSPEASPAQPASPVLTRTQSRQPSDSANICPGADSGTTGGELNNGVGWCFAAFAAHVNGGERLTVQACRDSTTGGTLTFDTTREVDLAVQRGSATVWDWGTDHPAQPSRHTLSTGADTCWDWSLVWPDITQSGTSAGHDSFTFVATSTARELSGYPPQKSSFSY